MPRLLRCPKKAGKVSAVEHLVPIGDRVPDDVVDVLRQRQRDGGERGERRVQVHRAETAGANDRILGVPPARGLVVLADPLAVDQHVHAAEVVRLEVALVCGGAGVGLRQVDVGDRLLREDRAARDGSQQDRQGGQLNQPPPQDAS